MHCSSFAQVEQGIQLGLPTSTLVKLSTAFSEHAAYVCKTGDGVAAGLDDGQKELLRMPAEAESPLQGLSLQESWLLLDKVLERLKLEM